MREHELRDILHSTNNGHHTVVKGVSGIGKSQLIKNVASVTSGNSDRVVVYMPSVTIRQALLQVASQLHEAIGLKLTAAALTPKVASQARMGRRLQWDDISNVNKAIHC